MARWRQVWSDEEGKYVLVPLDESAAKRDASMGIIVRGNFDAFRSPIDGSLIDSHRDYVDHCKRHNVVPAQEFSQEFFDRKAREREKFYRAEYTKDEQWKRKAEIHEIWNRAERGLN